MTQDLDSDLDWTTFELGSFGFGEILATVPPGRTSYSTRVDATASLGVQVDVTATFNLQTGRATWTFTSVDPMTLDLPADPFAGFLPPNVTAPEGDGFVSYNIFAKQGAATGTRIDAQASVIFDTNEPLATEPIFNTLDVGGPSSHVLPLPDKIETASFTVSWTGVDDTDGSGVANYDVFVSTDGGPFEPWLTHAAETSHLFTLPRHHTYAFYSVARDNVGHVELPALLPDTATYFAGPISRQSISENSTLAFTLQVEDPDTIAGLTAPITYSIVSGTQTGISLDGTTGVFSWTPAENQEGTYTTTLRATGANAVANNVTITFSVQDVNDPPVLAHPGNKSLNESATASFTLTATDGDLVAGVADSVSYSIVSGNVSGMALDNETGAFSWTPTESQDGQSVVVFRAKDNHDETSVDQTVTITVKEVNDPPVLVNPGSKTIAASQPLAFAFSATDSDVVAGAADAISFSILTGAATGMTLNDATGEFEWTPTAGQVGEHLVTFRAADNHGGVHDQSVTITVSTSNRAPTDIHVSSLSVNENASGVVLGDITVDDPDAGQTHALVVSDNRFEIVAGKLQLKAGIALNFESSASLPLEITATDSGSPAMMLTKSFTVVVNDVNDPPSLINLSNATVRENILGATVGTLLAIDQDAGQTHSFVTNDARFEIVGQTLKLKNTQFVTGISVTVDVVATDSGSPAQMFTQSLVITLIPNVRAWQYTTQPFDTNADGSVVPLDALRIINQLNEPTILAPNGKLPDGRLVDSSLPYYDTNGDGFCTSNDVLRVINYLNSQLGEGEAASAADTFAEAMMVDLHRDGTELVAPSERSAKGSGSVTPSSPSIPPSKVVVSTANRTEPRRSEFATSNLDAAVDAILEEIVDDVAQVWWDAP